VNGGRMMLLAPLLPFLMAFDPLTSSNREVELGNQQMKAGKAEEALGFYDKAVAKLPNDPGAHFDRGAALYALSRFEEASQEFLRATEAKDGALKASAFYNLGNAFFKKDKFKEAIEAYKRAMTLDPRDAHAKWNLEIALRKQKDEEEKKKKDQDKDKDKKDQDQKKDDKKDQDKKDQKKDDGKDQKKPDQPQKKDGDQPQDKKPPEEKPPQAKPPEAKPGEEQEIGAVLDSLERDPKELEKERARLRAVRRRPPDKDW
jgi:Ca-activated chloride channel family protein